MSLAPSNTLHPKRRRGINNPFTGYGFVALWMIGLLAFTAFPLIFSFVISFFRWGLLDTPEFVGFRNYIQMFTIDRMFRQSLRVTLTYSAFAVPLSLIFALAIAMILNIKIKGQSIFRTLYYLPSVIAGVAVSVVWMWMLQPDFGILNQFLSFFGIDGPDWLGDPNWALTAMIVVAIWSTSGPQVIIYLAGLKNIPQDLYEAASIDGAGRWYRFTHVTIPMLTPTIFFNLIMGIIGSLSTFTQAFVMTDGGPANSTLFYALYLYNRAFRDLQMGYAAAMSWVLFLIIVFFTVLVFKSSVLWVHYEAERK